MSTFTSVQTESQSTQHLRLTRVGFDAVEFAIFDEYGYERPVVVRVGSAPNWYRAVTFPSTGSEATESTGDDELDERIRRRAGEELVRLAAAVGASEERPWAA